MRCFSALLLAAGTYMAQAQTIPASRLTDWSHAGLQDTVPAYPTVIDIMSHGADNTGATPSDAALQAAITALNGKPGTVFFPSGTYKFNQSVAMRDSLVLKGNGNNNTRLIFDLGHIETSMFEFKGTAGSTVWDVTEPIAKDDNYIVLNNTTGISKGNWLHLYGDDVALTTSAWAYGTVGQIVQVADVKNDTIVTVQKMRRSYDMSFAAKMKMVDPIKWAGLECMYIQRYDSTIGQSNNINFDKAVNCWVIGVESDSTNFCHIAIFNSAHILARANYLHHSHAYGGSGQGYGVAIHYTSGDCLIENNKLEHLRHSMLVQAGANGNVFAYNYSKDPYWDEPPFPTNSAGDIVCHGNYPFMNLFEGNVVQNVVIDNSHGINGPFNTIFRNKAGGYGIFMNNNPATDSMNIVANEVTNVNTGLYTLQGTGHFELVNNVKGTITPAGITTINHTSLFRLQKPPYWDFWEFWPGIGTPFAGNNNTPIPATYKLIPDCTINPKYQDIHVDEVRGDKTALAVYPNPAAGMVNFEYTAATNENVSVSILDMTGRLVAVLPLQGNTGKTQWNVANTPPGIYLYQLHTGNGVTQTGKLVISQ